MKIWTEKLLRQLAGQSLFLIQSQAAKSECGFSREQLVFVRVSGVKQSLVQTACKQFMLHVRSDHP